jgi:dolichyl-phosphate beta-glucosyltransferase
VLAAPPDLLINYRPDLTIIIPAYNEARRLPATLHALQAFLTTRPWEVEIVVVDDGSTDDTVGAVKTAENPASRLRVVSLGVNQGKGAAVKRGVAEAGGACIAYVDADLPYAFSGFDVAMKLLAAGADIVIGGRDLPGSSAVVGYTWIRSLSGKVYSILVNLLAVRAIPDTQCGFKWFRAGVAKEIFPQITLTGFAFDVELLVLAQRWGLRIERIPVSLSHSHDSTVRLVRDSCQMLWDLVKIYGRRARGLYERAETGDHKGA